MNINRTAFFAALLLLAASAASAGPTNYHQKIREVPNVPVEVEIWTDRGDGSRYCAGESIEVYFRTNVDAWVAIYDIDTRGDTHRLFPSRHAPDNFVRGGEVNRLPARYGYHFQVEGPTGWETLRAVASIDRRDLRGYHGVDYLKREPAVLPTSSARGPRALPNKIREVPNHPPHEPALAIAETRHFVRDGYRCRTRPDRPWWEWRQRR
ncbi:MAG: DUF4384 domain-containing protein [Acidobacteriota bacterium]